jgi:putative lipoic acid-binding regulatory protein
MDIDHLNQLMTFPVAFTFRVVALGSPGLRAACLALAEGALGRAIEQVEEQASSGGRYQTVRLVATIEQPEEIATVYGALSAVPGLKLLL